LTLIARAQADLILQGKTAFGSEAGLFDYHAQIVNIRPVSATTTKDVQELEGERIFLLGCAAALAAQDPAPVGRTGVEARLRRESLRSPPRAINLR